ncbi:ferric reductase-like transmembrane domain-containing protein [Patescibacteria group bacterium]|nr:ferric reductase-like transmembrane domain-containing protein [Patescibacteria group bacterium]
MCKNFFFKGQIPYFSAFRKLLMITWLIPFYIFVDQSEFGSFGWAGWWLLIFTVYVRPLSDILPKLGILKTLIMLRKEMGILAGLFILAHGIGFFLKTNNPFPASLWNPKFWNFNTLFGWGMAAFILILIVLLVSNKWGIKYLKRWWKPVQRLTYPVMILSAIHISFAEDENKITMVTLVIIMAILWILANRKVVLWKN